MNDFSGEAIMADEPARSRLGRGLASLMGDMGAEPNNPTERSRGQRRVPIEFLRPNPRNPRRDFPLAQLSELAASIKERGIIQPIAVRAVRGATDVYEIIAGERRWQAAQRANLHEVPIVILDVSDAEALELAIIENVQREDLNPIEEATGYQALADEFKYHQDDIAKTVGKSRSHIANMLRLLKLPDAVKASLRSGEISAGHARALVGHDDPGGLVREIIERGLNVRQVEDLTRTKPKAQVRKHEKAADTLSLEKRVADAIGMEVKIEHRGEGGMVQIKYRDLDQLADIVKRLERTS